MWTNRLVKSNLSGGRGTKRLGRVGDAFTLLLCTIKELNHGMRYIFLFSAIAGLLIGCANQSRNTSSAPGSAPGGRLNEKQLAAFIVKAREVADDGFYSHRAPDGAGAECEYVRTYDGTIPPRCYQSPDGDHVSVMLTYYQSLSGRTGTLLQVEFDTRTGDVTKSTMKTFVSDTF